MVATWHEFWGEHWDAYLPERPVVARMARGVEAGAAGWATVVARLRLHRARDGHGRDGRGPGRAGNGVDLSEIASARAVLAAADIVFVGRLIDEKRVDLLLDAVARLRRECPARRCSIVGDGPERPRLRGRGPGAWAADRRVRFHGRLRGRRGLGRSRPSRILVCRRCARGSAWPWRRRQAAGTVPVVVRSAHSGAATWSATAWTVSWFRPTALPLAEAIAGRWPTRAV